MRFWPDHCRAALAGGATLVLCVAVWLAFRQPSPAETSNQSAVDPLLSNLLPHLKLAQSLNKDSEGSVRIVFDEDDPTSTTSRRRPALRAKFVNESDNDVLFLSQATEESEPYSPYLEVDSFSSARIWEEAFLMYCGTGPPPPRVLVPAHSSVHIILDDVFSQNVISRLKMDYMRVGDEYTQLKCITPAFFVHRGRFYETARLSK